MAEVFTTAGRGDPQPAPAEPSPRKSAIKAISAVLRDPQASDEAREDALEALVELSKE